MNNFQNEARLCTHPAQDTPPSRDRLPKDQPHDANIHIQIGPVDADAVANQLPAGALIVRSMTQPRVPGQRRTHVAILGSTYNRGESTPMWHALSRSYLFPSLATTPSASTTSDSSQQ